MSSKHPPVPKKAEKHVAMKRQIQLRDAEAAASREFEALKFRGIPLTPNFAKKMQIYSSEHPPVLIKICKIPHDR